MKVKGPPVVHAGPFVRKVADRLIAGVPYHDHRRRGNAMMMRKFSMATSAYLEGCYQRQLVGKALKSKMADCKKSRIGSLENF